MAVIYKVIAYLMGTTGPIQKLCIGAQTSSLRHYLFCIQEAKWSTQAWLGLGLVILHTYPPMKMEQSVPKRWHIKFRRREITQKKAYNL